MTRNTLTGHPTSHSERLSGYILAVGVFAGTVLAMLKTTTFWIAQTLLAWSSLR